MAARGANLAGCGALRSARPGRTMASMTPPRRPRKRRPKPKPLAGHQKSWLWGRNAVLEALRAGTWPILELHLAAELGDEARQAALARARELGAETRVEPGNRLKQLCHAPEHQGYLAKMAEFPYANVAAVLDGQWDRPLFMVLDGLQDPHNLGAILRSAEVFGVDAVFLGEHGQVGVTTAVARASAGAVSRLTLARDPDLKAVAVHMRRKGIRLVAASEKAEMPIAAFDFTAATALVIGSEAHGIRPVLLERCDAMVRIPQHGAIGSLNAAAATAVCLYEARRQREAAP